ncbi:response regulator [Blautia sp.]|jgi:CheY-like chemotaxis protein|uniref:response regulator n=2 Tax=Blautia sp. TaxID=1955243 RepID=UPI003AB8063B
MVMKRPEGSAPAGDLRPFGKTIPIIAMTANAFAEDIVRSSEAGMDAHITKPIDENKLKECMLRLLASR